MVLVAALLVGCGPSAPQPELTGVTPARGWRGEATDVVIEGDHLLPSVTLGADDPVGGDFEAWLTTSDGEVRLEGAELVDYDHLAAQVPAGLPPGDWPLHVRTPSGAEATLESAFLVSTTRADHIRLQTARAAFELGEYAGIEVLLEDPNDEAVSVALGVELRATSSSGAVGVEFAAGQLGGQTASTEGVGIVGELDADGATTVLVRSTVADDVRFSAHALDEAGVTDGELLLTWQEGDLAQLVVSLPFSPFRARAGQPFTVHVELQDSFGNALPDTYARLSLTDACGNYRSIEDVFGEADLEVELTTACPVDRLTFFNSNVEVESEPFEVVPADMEGYRVTATPDAGVQAGVQPVLVLVEAVDAYGNLVSDFADTFTLSDTLAGIDSARTTCPSMSAGTALCTTYLRRAGADRLVVGDTEGRTGQSGEVEVVADDAVALSLSLAAPEVVAGEVVLASVGAYDTYGNVVTIEPGGVDPVTFDDDGGSVDCAWTGPAGEGRHGFECTFTTAWEEAEVTAAIARLGLAGTAPDPITVVNAGLADVTLAAPASAVAGTAFTVTIAGFDEFGNPYLEQSDPVLTLADETGTLTPVTATLDADGEAEASVAITTASGSTRISASQAGSTLGRSGAIRVSAGPMHAFAVDVPAWVDVDGGLDVTVSPVDSFGNVVSTYTGTPTVSVTDDACDPVTLPALAGEAADTTLDCTAPALGVVASAEDGTFSGSSDPVDVVDFACASPPEAALSLDGEASPSLCLASGEVTADADAAASTAGAAPLSVYAFEDDEGNRARGTSSSTTFTWTGAGPRRVTTMVADEDACASEADAWAWVGEDDGEVTGPVDLVVSAESVYSGGTVTVEAVAYDCTGDVAAGQDLHVRATLGEVAGTASGSGLIVTLDAAGEASFSWTFPTGYAAGATLYAGSASAGGYGEASIAVTQDSARPHVIEVIPAGTTSATVESVVVRFDEAILESTVSNVTLTGPAGAVTVTRELDGDTLTLTPADPVDAASGTFTVTASSSVRDEAGNRLDGSWSGSAGGVSTVFGAVADTLPSTLGCTSSDDVFRPDGDDGAGDERDDFTLTPLASGAPTWWWLHVEDAGGDGVRDLRVDGSSTTASWDGRADDGLVLPGGEYQVILSAIDAQDNTAEVCTAWVTLDHRLELP